MHIGTSGKKINQNQKNNPSKPIPNQGLQPYPQPSIAHCAAALRSGVRVHFTHLVQFELVFGLLPIFPVVKYTPHT